MTLSDGEWIDEDGFGLETVPRASEVIELPQEDSANSAAIESFNLDAVTERLVIAALKRSRGHKARAVAMLGVHPRTLTRMMRRYGMSEELGDDV